MSSEEGAQVPPRHVFHDQDELVGEGGDDAVNVYRVGALETLHVLQLSQKRRSLLVLFFSSAVTEAYHLVFQLQNGFKKKNSYKKTVEKKNGHETVELRRCNSNTDTNGYKAVELPDFSHRTVKKRLKCEGTTRLQF